MIKKEEAVKAVDNKSTKKKATKKSTSSKTRSKKETAVTKSADENMLSGFEETNEFSVSDFSAGDDFSIGSIISKTERSSPQNVLEQTVQYEKRIYDLEQLIDIAKSFCENLDFSNLLESIVYISMAQMHTLGAHIFVRDLISNDNFILETGKINPMTGKKTLFPVSSPIALKFIECKKPLTLAELEAALPDCTDIEIFRALSPTLIVPLIQKNHLNGILILQERIAIDDDTSYSDYEQNQIMSIASLASVAINNAALIEKSSTDMMTHLRLKYYFYNKLTEAIDSAFLSNNHISVLMFDIDFFKKFNDTYGHECGDFVLIKVAELIKKSLRDSDVASRYGGEEFTVLLNDADSNEAMKVAERIRSTIDAYDFVYNNQHLHVTISVGVSTFDTKLNCLSSPNEFVIQADKGLYMSKTGGRNRVTFYDPLDNGLEELD